MRPGRQMMSSATTVAVAMMVMNVLIYAFNLIAARILVPAEWGALTALLSIILIANVVALALQAAIARRISLDPEHTAEIVHTASRVALAVSLTVGAAVAASTVVLTPAFSFESIWAVVFAGAMVVPLTLVGAQMGVAQGTGRWKRLAAVFVASGLGRILGGGLGLAIDRSATGAMAGLAVGAWIPVVLGTGLLRASGKGDLHSRRPLVAETALSAWTLLAYFVFSNIDALIARGGFDAHTSGLYAAGLILTKSTLFLPQFVSVVFFPSLARDSSHRTRLLATGLVGVLGIGVVAVAAALPHLTLILVGGDQYAEVSGNLWLFAVSGTFLAMVYLLVFDALARRERGVSLLVWGGSAIVFCVAFFGHVEIAGLVTAMALVAAGITAILLAWPLLTGRREPATSRS